MTKVDSEADKKLEKVLFGLTWGESKSTKESIRILEGLKSENRDWLKSVEYYRENAEKDLDRMILKGE